MKNSPVDKVKSDIIADIASGFLKEGEKLPSVRFLCKIYETGRTTICKVLADLAEMDLIELEERKSPRIKAWKGRKIAIVYSSKTDLFNESFWQDFYFGINDVISKDKQWKVEYLNISSTYVEKVMDYLYCGEFSGIIVLGVGPFHPFWEASSAVKKLPIVYVSVDYSFGLPYEIRIDFKNALVPVKRALSTRKSVRCLFFTGYDYPLENMEMNQKYLEIVKILKGGSADIELITTVKETKAQILEKLTGIFKRKQHPDFCVAYTDRDAPVLLRAIHNAGLNCPEDVMLLSYDNMFASQTTIPSQTSIEMHRREAGCSAAETMLNILEKRPTEKIRSIQAELIERESFICKKENSKRLNKGEFI